MAAAITLAASKSTSCSRRSITTKPPMCGAWISPSAPPRAMTTRRARFCGRSIFRSGSEAKSFRRGTLRRSNGEEELNRKEQSAPPHGEEIFGPARAAQSDRARQEQTGRGAFCRHAQARRIAAQFLGHADSQPLRADRAAPRLLPQAQTVAHRAAGARLQRADPRTAEVELVR